MSAARAEGSIRRSGIPVEKGEGEEFVAGITGERSAVHVAV